MALDTMFVILLACWGIVLFGFYIKDFYVVALPCLGIVVWGLQVIIKGLVGYQDWFTETFAIVNAFAALYIFLRGSWELYKND